LINHGHEVVLFSRKKPIKEFCELEWFEGDINSVEDCFKAVNKKGFDAIHSLAAKTSPTDQPGNPMRDDVTAFPLAMQTNIMGLYNLLQAAIRNDIGTFVQTGSNCVLGHGFRISNRPLEIKYFPIDEWHPTDVEDSYSFSKLAGEKLMESYANTYGIRCYSLRSAGIVDAGVRDYIKNNTKPTNEWSEWMFSWIASEDLASAHRLLMEKANSIVSFGAYYCNNDDTTLHEPTMDIIKKFRPDLIPLIREPLDGHAALFSNKLLKSVVGWKPEKSWR
jgi:nucleoside-diphosphate-sugar epimerase